MRTVLSHIVLGRAQEAERRVNALLRMWERRQRGYEAIGYRLAVSGMLGLESPTQTM